MGKHVIVKVGEEFKLNCGVDVVVLEVKNSNNITVRDKLGNTKICKAAALRTGIILWPWYKELGIIRPKCKKPKSKRTVCVKKDKIYPTKKYGDILILEVESYTNIKVKFLKTNNIQIVKSCNSILKGTLRDNLVFQSTGVRSVLKVGSVRISKQFGPYKIVCMKNLSQIKVLWLETGEETSHEKYTVLSNTLRNTEKIKNETSLNPKEGFYYVYTVNVDEDIVYVGYGKGNRYLHCTSGTSHNLELNRMYFVGDNLVCGIFSDGLSKNEAIKLEKFLIQSYKPFCNYVNNCREAFPF